MRRRASRFGEHGLDGLYDLPRSGRPKTVSKKRMDCIMSKAKLTFYSCNVAAKYLLFHRNKISHNPHRKNNASIGMSAKTAQGYHTNHAMYLL